MPLFTLSHPSLIQARSFTCTARVLAKSSKQRLKFEHSAVPPYPYGPSQFYKQSNFGLYGRQKIRFGNMVSERNEIKTRRYWRPNVHSKRLWSNALQAYIRTRITTRVLRTVDKVGGLDEYLLGEKAGRIKELGMGGWKLRWRIMQTDAVKERFQRQREQMGLPPKEEALINSNGTLVTEEQFAAEIMAFDQELEMGTDVGIGEDLEAATTEESESSQEEREFMQEEPARPDRVVL